jgi:hypothetical protein
MLRARDYPLKPMCAVPMIDAAYRTIPDRDRRAMAGLSMGGMQTLHDSSRLLRRISRLLNTWSIYTCGLSTVGSAGSARLLGEKQPTDTKCVLC